MNDKSTLRRPELLAPAGNLSCALAAFDAGADAVYAGLKRFNARERTENFSMDEMSKLLCYAHKNDRKVYLTFNTLIKESELGAAASELAELNSLRPDAVIVQDLGVVRMIREYFPHLKIHASTQMGLHNSAGLAFAEQLGVERVILERQATLRELGEMMKKKPESLELEVFVHGALCCCISGSCLLSSWLGGWSGNRGKCKQPCRRRHHSSEGNGFFLSSQDLCTIEILPEIMKAGVASLKIEGRLRRADYVTHVVRAYRLAIDAAQDPKQFKATLPAAKEILAKTGGRKWSLGFYTPESAGNLVKFDAMGVSGQLCGNVVSCSQNGFTVAVTRRIHMGDTIRIQPRSGDEGPALCVTRMSVNGQSVKRALKGERCFIHSDKEVPSDGVVYKTGESTDDFSRRIAALPLQKPVLDLEVSISRANMSVRVAGLEWTRPLELDEAGMRPLQSEQVCREFRNTVFQSFSVGGVDVSISQNPFLPASVFKSLRQEFRDWLETHLTPGSETVSSRLALQRFQRDYDAMQTSHADSRRFPSVYAIPRGKRFQLPDHAEIAREIPDDPSPHEELILPFFVNETSVDEVRNSLKRFLEKGGRCVRITSLHQIALLPQTAVSNGTLMIKTCMPLPVCNSLAAIELKRLGVSLAQAWLELEKSELELLAAKSPLPLELYRYGRPPLLSTRAAILPKKEMTDARGNVFRIERTGLLTQLYADRVMMVPHVKGINAEFFDLRHAVLGESDPSSFNFDFTLS